MAVSSFGGNQLFKKEEKKAKAFLDSCLQIHYQQQFKMKFIGTLNEFGKIHGFLFHVIERQNKSIVMEYFLEYSAPLEFDKQRLEKDYEILKFTLNASKELESFVLDHYPNALVLSRPIATSDSTFRWVNDIFTAEPLPDEKEKTFMELNLLCDAMANRMNTQDVVFNFFFPIKTRKKIVRKSNHFFEYPKFSKKHTYHYRVDFEKTENEMKIVKELLYDNLNKKNLYKVIEKWKNQNGYEDWEISFLIESSTERDLAFKKFMLKGPNGEKKMGFIHVENYELYFIDN